jgi:choline-sulfatase
MLRRGSWKLVYSPADPDQLFDLAADPHERRNLAEDPAAAGVLAELRAGVATRWDLPRIDREVRASQRHRRVVGQALGRGRPSSWDFAPGYDASRRYIRNHLDLGELEAVARYPAVRGSSRAQREDRAEP